MEKRVDIFNLLRNEGQLENVLVYPATETVNDPFAKTTDKAFLNPITIKALISSVGFSALKWKYFGQLPTGSIQIIVENKHKNLLLVADKIEYNSNFYRVYKDDSQSFQFMERKDFIVFVLGLKNL